MRTHSRWSVPLEPQIGSQLTVLLMPSLFGISQPNYTSLSSLFAAGITSTLTTLLVCSCSYGWLRLGTKNQKAVQNSRDTSQNRQKMGYGKFAVNLALFLWMTNALMEGAVWLVFRGLNGSAAPFTLCLARALLVGTITAIGLFVQAVALDRFYRDLP